MPKKLRPAGDLVVFKYSTLKVNIIVCSTFYEFYTVGLKITTLGQNMLPSKVYDIQ